MKFDVLGIILMIVAIWVGTFVGAGISGFIGFGGGIVGSFIVGFIVYLIYTLLHGGKIVLMQGLIFAILVYVAQIIAGLIGGYTGLGGGLIGLAVTGFILAMLWGWFGGKASPIQMGKTSAKKGRK